MTSYGSSTEPRSPVYGTATFSTLSQSQTPMSPSRYSYTSSSETPMASSDSDGATSDRYMRRVHLSPTHSYDSYSDDNSIDETAEVEAVLNDIDTELDNTEDVLTEWSRGSSSGGPSYTGTTPSYTTTMDTYSAYDRDRRILSTITERTENPSRPNSYALTGGAQRPANPTPEGNRLSIPRSGAHSPALLHARSPTDSTYDRPQGRRTGDLIAFFEDRSMTPSETSFGHSRTTSAPGGYRTMSPFFPHSQSTPNLGSTTGYGYTTTGYDSRPSSPAKSKSGSTVSSSASSVSEALSLSSLLSPPTRGPTTTTTRSGTQLSPSDFASTFSNTFTASRSATTNLTPTASSLRRPQTSPRSPLTSVRNIVAAWKERTPSLAKTAKSSTESVTSPPTRGDGLFSLRRRAERGENRLRENAIAGKNSAEGLNGNGRPTTPKSVASSIIPPPFDLVLCSHFALGSYGTSTCTPDLHTDGNDAKPYYTLTCWFYRGSRLEEEGVWLLLICLIAQKCDLCRHPRILVLVRTLVP
ncbi:hypothetical protein BJ138DRAFT_1151897 [Hygrophoropsis aurantiaca]|uniref:Uncharacterized protein n=1 Tax=Hygrophoropsis aurantiaca TaxID=72124 RepID=A0ACB8ABZ3_9AGAM|nr:hypothetical protein BJ138DRAFT_1151897 [Hygrophoropsis aurantiaca]